MKGSFVKWSLCVLDEHLGLLDFGGGGRYARGLRFFAGLVGKSNECGSRMGQSPEYKAVDLFCGAGGLSLGLHWAGWKVEIAVEQDSAASTTYRHNFPGTMFLEKDVRDVCFSDYKGIDLVAGGPPCQPFSVAGEQLAENDPRDMVPAFVRVVREIRPKSFLMENVPGLLTAKHKTYTSSVVRMFRSLDYEVRVCVFDAADYGVPQHRERVFFLGLRHDMEVPFLLPEPEYGKGKAHPHVTVREALYGTPADTPNTAKVTYCKNPVLRPSPWAGMLVNGGGRPIHLDEPCQTIPATAGGNRTHIVDEKGVLREYHRYLMEGGQPRVGEVEGVRRLTARESARIQSFPDTFRFLGAKSSIYRQIGNAVPPLLAKAVGLALKRSLLRVSQPPTLFTKSKAA